MIVFICFFITKVLTCKGAGENIIFNVWAYLRIDAAWPVQQQCQWTALETWLPPIFYFPFETRRITRVRHEFGRRELIGTPLFTSTVKNKQQRGLPSMCHNPMTFPAVSTMQSRWTTMCKLREMRAKQLTDTPHPTITSSFKRLSYFKWKIKHQHL